MPAPTALLPGKNVPALKLKLSDGSDWSLSDENSENFTLLAFYRGYHCPKCREQLLELQRNLPELQSLGVNAIAITMDGIDRASKAQEEWGLQNLRFAHGLTAAQARQWGLYLSSGRGLTSIGVEEATLFNEPALFLVRPDGSLYAAWVQSVPFARPHVGDVISAIKFVLEKNYPPRGIIEDI